MPQTHHVRYTRQAAEQLQQIFDYIARDSPANAARLIGRLIDAVDSLALLPHRYSVVRNADRIGIEIRSMPVRPYLIRYHVDKATRTVTVLGVRHGARRPEP